MKSRRARVVVPALVAFVLATLQAHAAGIGLPSIPGVPSLNPQDIAIKAAAKELAPYLAAHAPVILDWNAVFPTTSTLPGKTFTAVSGTRQDVARASISSQLAHSSSGVVELAPGDYEIQVRVYCTDVHRHAGHQALWLMGPLRGAREPVLSTLYARASGKNVNFGTMQSLSWAMQAGVRYDELPMPLRLLFDQLAPGMRGQIAGDFVEQLQDQWSHWSSTIPNLPSMDEALGRMGDAGQTVLQIEYARDAVLANASDFDALSRMLAPPGGSAADDANAGPPPWSIVVPDKVFERILTPGSFGSASTIEIRVVGPGKTDVPFTSVISYPPNHKDWQPLTHESPLIAFGQATM